MEKPFRYGIIGPGAIGTTIGVLLKQAGMEVSVLCGYREKFLTLSRHPAALLGLVNAEARFTDVFEDLGSFLDSDPDVILICTKSCDSPAILENIKTLRPHIRCTFVSCQNGLGVEDQIAAQFGESKTLRLVLNLGAQLINESEVKISFFMTHFLSDRPQVPTQMTSRIAQDLNRAGFKTEIRKDYQTEIFRKAILNSAMGSICALTGMTIRQVLDDPDLVRMSRQMVREGIAVAQAMQLPIESEFLEEAMKYFERGGNHKPSILLDLEKHRPTENESQCGAIFRYAEKFKVEVAVIQTIYYLIKNKERVVLAGG